MCGELAIYLQSQQKQMKMIWLIVRSLVVVSYHERIWWCT
jgi:hypothetical protein